MLKLTEIFVLKTVEQQSLFSVVKVTLKLQMLVHLFVSNQKLSELPLLAIVLIHHYAHQPSSTNHYAHAIDHHSHHHQSHPLTSFSSIIDPIDYHTHQ